MRHTLCFDSLVAFLANTRGIDAANAGVILGLLLLSGAIGSPVFGVLSDKFGRKLMAIISGLIGAVIALFIFLTTYGLIITTICVFFLGFATLPSWSLFLAIAQESVVKDFVSSVTGIVQTFGLVGCAVGPILAGAIIASAGFVPTMICTGTLPSLSYGLISLGISGKNNYTPPFVQ